MVDGILRLCDVMVILGTEVLPRKTVVLVNTCEAVILDVDSTTEDVCIGCIVEETVTVGLVTGPMNRCERYC